MIERNVGRSSMMDSQGRNNQILSLEKHHLRKCKPMIMCARLTFSLCAHCAFVDIVYSLAGSPEEIQERKLAAQRLQAARNVQKMEAAMDPTLQRTCPY